MKCSKLHNKKLLLKEYALCPLCGVKIQEMNNKSGQEITEIDYRIICGRI